jgi:hypothetical protein
VSSLRRQISSRANGALSRGPKTEAGKRRSSRNALRHGCRSRQPGIALRADESPQAIDAILQLHLSSFKPRTPAERACVDRMVVARWRLLRIRALDDQLWNEAFDSLPAGTSTDDSAQLVAAFHLLCDKPHFDALSRYGLANHNAYFRNLYKLLSLQRRPVPLLFPTNEPTLCIPNVPAATGSPAPKSCKPCPNSERIANTGMVHLGIARSILLGLTLTLPTLAAVDFNREIRPILSDNCFKCHGPDDKHRMANLRLDMHDGGAYAQRAKGALIVPGDAAKSALYQRVSNPDKNRRMPPPNAELNLNPKQVQLIKEWIDEGAKWETHWAFSAPVRPTVPPSKDLAWVKNPIDNFVLARLDAEGLKPSPEADRITLLRRVTFDLTGLPPTPEEVAAFLADKSPDAYEKQVDRLLRSPHYGERMAMQWLDLARYADSHGYHIDSHRHMWPWRDWLIRAYNDNMPFDRFTVLQLAGDLLPNANTDDKIASGFNRNHMINFEGGAIPEEYQVEYVADRVEATSNTWMGLTMGCARCHSHKYDPISQKEFYQFFAFFNSVSEKGLDGKDGNAAPFLQLPTPDQEARVKDLAAQIKSTEAVVNAQPVTDAIAAWKASLAAKPAPVDHNALVAHYQFDGSLADSSGHYLDGRTIKGDPTFGEGQIAKALSLDGQTVVTLGNAGSFERNAPFSIALWLRPSGSKQAEPVLEKIADSKTRKGYELWLVEPTLIGIQNRASRIELRITSEWPQSTLRVRTRDHYARSDWKHFAFTYDGSGKAAGLKLYIDGKPTEIEILSDTLSGPIRSDAELQIGVKEPDAANFNGSLDDLRFYSRALPPQEIEHMAIEYPVQAVLSGVGGKLTKIEETRLREHYLRFVADSALRDQYANLKALQAQSAALQKQILTTMVMSEMEKPRDTFLLARGDYRNQTDKVEPGTPAVLPPLTIHNGKRATRLDLAEWLVDPAHPLTARVAVNRYWMMYFGNGIVKTAENFGSQGDPPSHPELLDWLATEFIRTRWDVRAMQRLIVTSAAYRQSSKVSPQLLEKDPDNRLIARGPRFRLPAEMVRDNALALSGLLNPAVGGPSVFPYQPKGLWEEMAFGDGFSMQTYVQSHGKDLYRRSMYTFWKRTVPPAQMSVFDAPDREKCTVRRTVTNTPLQALVLLNDPTYLESARRLAERVIREAGRDPIRRATLAFEFATARKPDKSEIASLLRLAKQETEVFAHDQTQAQKLLKNGETEPDPKMDKIDLAAWTTVTSAILNLDETITVE